MSKVDRTVLDSQVRVTLDRFMSKVRKTRTCWIWTGSLDRFGYGRFQDGYSKLAHRWMMEFEQGRPLVWTAGKRETVNHRCLRKHCVRPSHLYVGTQAENVRDALEAGTHRNVQPKTHCNNGHPKEFSYRAKQGFMRCRICLKATNRRAYLRRTVSNS